MGHSNVETLTDQLAIGSPESDMEFVPDWKGDSTDVIRFKPGRRPLFSNPDAEKPALYPGLPAAVLQDVEPRPELAL